ncbi:putative lipid II flippase FtsW [Kingella negevensis]|uniref:Probable peptidoglycan glycosyltransferase FtsW n=1 Tax=Kingella negevensis TaxID=1522312 RepID=A0A238TAL0_9NEIS|nr:putative lipid II flippase FtsW [Kingella negevensis]MDK4680851.1 putative lipid II flippase FtsW [Kingella negevensis]MDK4681426.1 putative lipid II flippase FtsW [Kingella negevensis]MDK4684914.1 putative lipid II flippase FtsW [Kingella negevensis]MDK4691812.1 putative lipid II flippase FtsW [Kingella negevensis]MDK4693034.1 putative lipid II flippase FtsW [Kingella negevensis]
MKPFSLSKYPRTSSKQTMLIEKILDRNLLKNGDTYDKTFVWLLLCLLCFGLVMVYSASGAQAGLYHFDNRSAFLIKQLEYALFGLSMAYVLMRVPMWRWQRWTKYLLIGILLVLVVLPFVGEEVNGARRWLNTPLGVKVQPSEMFKLITIIYMADFFKRKVDVLHDFNRVLMVGIPIAVGAGFVLLTRDLGSVMVILGIFLCLLFLANMPIRWFLGAVSVSLATVVLVIVSSEFRMRRISVMWQPWKDPTGTGYQGLGSLLSMERGGLFGEGLGNAIFKRGFLPEAHTDFILAVIGEELGLITVAALVFVYVWIIWRAFSIGKQARDLELHFNSFIAVGIGVWVAAQSFINIGVNISLLPNKGLTLPLVSYGGSSLVIMLIAFTMLLRVDYENRRKMRGYCVADPRDKRKQREIEDYE